MLYQMSKHRDIIPSNPAVYLADPSGLINGSSKEEAHKTLAVKVKHTERQHGESLGCLPIWDLDLDCRPQVLAGATDVLLFTLTSSHTTHKMERHMVAFSQLRVHVRSNLSFKPCIIPCQR